MHTEVCFVADNTREPLLLKVAALSSCLPMWKRQLMQMANNVPKKNPLKPCAGAAPSAQGVGLDGATGRHADKERPKKDTTATNSAATGAATGEAAGVRAPVKHVLSQVSPCLLSESLLAPTALYMPCCKFPPQRVLIDPLAQYCLLALCLIHGGNIDDVSCSQL
jgi:hypothetical protein